MRRSCEAEAAADNSLFHSATQTRTEIAHGTIPREQELDGETKVDDVGILDEILFAFEPEFAGFLAFCFAAVNDEVLVGDHLGANKAALDIAMNFAGGFFGDSALGDRPGAHFVFPGGKKTDQIEQGVRDAD